ncbi:PIN domain-containing protein [Candidatus Gottesmanbacteria bacterium]|nr:PIN domain-containing protein [Candidatus Gottesmanbacteria bacterium]
MISIVDTDALLGLVSVDDPLHLRAKLLSQYFQDQNAALIISPTTLAEFSLVGLKRLGLAEMKKSLSSFLKQLVIEGVGANDLHMAQELLAKQESKDHSFCDCCVMVLANRLHADCIFSFDRGYTKNGFVLAEDLVKKK